MEIKVDKVLPNPEQPRTVFDLGALRELAASMAAHGLIQAITVDEAVGGVYILHDGERRLRAAKLLGWETIRADVVESINGAGPRERLERALVANIQREDMNPIEEARAFRQMMNVHGMTYEQIAQRLGKSNHAGYQFVTIRMKWLELEPEIQDLVAKGKLPVSKRVAEALLDVPDPDLRVRLAQKFAKHGMKINSIALACKRAAEKLQDGGEVDADSFALRYAREKADRPRGAPMKWDALQQVGQVPPWKTVTDTARETCEACALRDIASRVTCSECAIVEFLRLLLVGVR